MSLEQNRHVRLREDLGEDPSLFRRLDLKRGRYALDELLPWNRPAVAGAEVRELAGFDEGGALVGGEDYDVSGKRHSLCREFVCQFPGGQHVRKWYERSWVGLVDVFDDDDAVGIPDGEAGELSLLPAVFPAGVATTDLGDELFDREPAHVEDFRLAAAERMRPGVAEGLGHHGLAGAGSADEGQRDRTESPCRRWLDHGCGDMGNEGVNGFILPSASREQLFLDLPERRDPVGSFLGAGLLELRVGGFLRTGHDGVHVGCVVRHDGVELEEVEHGAARLDQHRGREMGEPDVDDGAKQVGHLVHPSAVQGEDAVDLGGEVCLFVRLRG